MSKITNDGLTRSGTGCFIGNSGRQRVTNILSCRQKIIQRWNWQTATDR